MPNKNTYLAVRLDDTVRGQLHALAEAVAAICCFDPLKHDDLHMTFFFAGDD